LKIFDAKRQNKTNIALKIRIGIEFNICAFCVLLVFIPHTLLFCDKKPNLQAPGLGVQLGLCAAQVLVVQSQFPDIGLSHSTSPERLFKI